MATSRQEKTYNEIIEYYNYADRLIRAVEDSNHELANEQFVIVETIIENLEKCADELTSHYIEYVKTDQTKEAKGAIKSALDSILGRIEECRSKILMISDKKI